MNSTKTRIVTVPKLNWDKVYESILFYNYDITNVLFRDSYGKYPELNVLIRHFIKKEEFHKVVILERLKKIYNSK